MLFAWQTTVFAEANGQVTIINEDAADPSLRLNGAQLVITNTESGTEYRDTIQYNGTVIFELPLGAYSVKQITPPDSSYELNTASYDFILQLPTGTNPENVKMVTAKVTLTNSLINDDLAAEPLSAAVEPIAAPLSPGDSVPVQIAIDKNPRTADYSLYAIIGLGFACAMAGVMILMIRDIKRL
jgi:hypothetical protein